MAVETERRLEISLVGAPTQAHMGRVRWWKAILRGHWLFYLCERQRTVGAQQNHTAATRGGSWPALRSTICHRLRSGSLGRPDILFHLLP